MCTDDGPPIRHLSESATMLRRVSDADCSTDGEGITGPQECGVGGLTVLILLLGEALCISSDCLLTI